MKNGKVSTPYYNFFKNIINPKELPPVPCKFETDTNELHPQSRTEPNSEGVRVYQKRKALLEKRNLFFFKAPALRFRFRVGE